jgi:hypothetical protein
MSDVGINGEYIEINLRELRCVCVCVDWTRLAYDRVHRRALCEHSNKIWGSIEGMKIPD